MKDILKHLKPPMFAEFPYHVMPMATPWAVRLCFALQGLNVFGQALHLWQQLLLLDVLGSGRPTKVS